MSVWCFPRICPACSFLKSDRPDKRRGNASFMVLALLALFTAVGLGLVFLGQVTLHAARAGKNLAVLDALAESGVKEEYAGLDALLNDRPFPLTLDEEVSGTWNDDPSAHAGEILETALGCRPPFASSGGWGAHRWEARTEFAPETVRRLETWFTSEYNVLVSSRSEIPDFSAGRRVSLEASLTITAGTIPLAFFPVLLDRKAGGGSPSSAPSPDRLIIHPGDGLNHLARILEPSERLLPSSALPAMEKALKLGIVRPQDLTPACLRKALGLPPSAEPVPEGVYLVRDEAELGGIFVRGDLDVLILAVRDDFQVLVFRQGESEWMILFSPSRNRTDVRGPSGLETFEGLPEPILIADGEIRAMGGGCPNGSGGYDFCASEETPCLLRGVRLTILSSGPVTIASHLIQQGVSWNRGIPYVKDRSSELVIFAGGTGLTSGEETGGGLFIGADAPQDLKIQAELVSAGPGVRILGGEKEVRLLGSLQTSALDLGQGRLNVHHDPCLLADDLSATHDLRTERPVLFVSSLTPRVWNDHE